MVTISFFFGGSIVLDVLLMSLLSKYSFSSTVTTLQHVIIFVLVTVAATFGSTTAYNGDLLSQWWNSKIGLCLLLLHVILRFCLLLAPSNFTLAEACVLSQGNFYINFLIIEWLSRGSVAAGCIGSYIFSSGVWLQLLLKVQSISICRS